MKEIFLNGAAFADNFGDILFFQVFSKAAIEKGYVVSMYSTDKKVKSQLPQVKFYSNKMKAIKNSYKIAYVGGGYFGEQPKPKLIQKLKWGIHNIRKIQYFGLLGIFYKKPIGIFGAGAGNITNPVTKFIIKKIVDVSEIVIVRDNESKEALSYVKNYKKNIDVSVDTILAIKDILPLDKKNPIKRILLHLSDSPEIDSISKILWDDVQLFITNHPEYTCTIITDHFTGGQKRSYDFFSKLSMTESQINVFKYTKTSGLIELIANSEIVITNKLHVGIVGISYNKKVIAVPNHPKVINLFNQLEIPEMILKKKDLKPEKLFSVMEKSRNLDYLLNEDIRIRAICNLERFKSFISEEEL